MILLLLHFDKRCVGERRTWCWSKTHLHISLTPTYIHTSRLRLRLYGVHPFRCKKKSHRVAHEPKDLYLYEKSWNKLFNISHKMFWIFKIQFWGKVFLLCIPMPIRMYVSREFSYYIWCFFFRFCFGNGKRFARDKVENRMGWSWGGEFDWMRW